MSLDASRRELAEFVNRMTAPVLRRVRNMIGRCILTLLDDSGGRQVVQISLYGGAVTLSGVERFQNYGFNSVPPTGAEGIYAELSGNPDHVVALAMESRPARPTGWDEYDVGMYDNLGQLVRLARAGIVINGAGLPVTITNTPKVHIDGELEATGEITAKAGSAASVTVSAHLTSNVQPGAGQGGAPVGGT